MTRLVRARYRTPDGLPVAVETRRTELPVLPESTAIAVAPSGLMNASFIHACRSGVSEGSEKSTRPFASRPPAVAWLTATISWPGDLHVRSAAVLRHRPQPKTASTRPLRANDRS